MADALLAQPAEITSSPRRRAARLARPGQKLLTGKQVELEYGVPYRSIFDLFLQGRLPAVKLGKRLWFRRSDVDSLILASLETR